MNKIISKNKIILAITAIAIAGFSVFYAAAGAFKINQYQQGQTKININQKTEIAPNGLAVYYTFDGPDMGTSTAYDMAGSNDGTFFHNACPDPVKVTGKIGQALEFDGLESAVQFNTAITTGTTWSVSMWIKPYGPVPGGILFGTGMNNSINFGGVIPQINYRYNPPNDVPNVGAISHYFNTTATADEWHHLTVAVSGGEAVFYWNGVQDGAASDAPSMSPSYVGMAASSAFFGKIDEFRFYTRAITQAEVTELYNQGAKNSVKINTPRTDLIPSGLVGYWTMDGQDVNWGDASTEIKDRSGNALHADATNMTAANATIGKIGQGINFNTTNASVHKTDSGTTPLDLPGSMTFSAWIKLDSLTSAMPMVVYKGGNFRFQLDDNGNCESPPSDDDQYEVYLFKPSGACSNNDVISQANRWYHIAATFNKDANPDYTQIYVDGVSAGGVAGDATPAVNDSTFIIGNWSVGESVLFPGKIDEVRVYNRALSASEIAELYNQGM